jgi:DNA-binding CsgD family transcriptional regulator
MEAQHGHPVIAAIAKHSSAAEAPSRPNHDGFMSAVISDAIHSLWDDLADFGAEQSAQAATHLMSFLCEKAGAWNATWAGATRLDGGRDDDPLKGWRVGAMQALHPVPPRPEEGHFKEILKVWDRREIDPSFLLPMQALGTFRTYCFRRDLPEDWFKSTFYQIHYGSVGTFDAAFIAFPLNEDCESHFGFYARKSFTDEAVATLANALRGIKWFHRNLMLNHGLLMASSPLSGAERRVLQLLLTDASEKDFAHQLSLASSTVHQYVVSIYRKFSVRSRAGLTRLWLRGAG